MNEFLDGIELFISLVNAIKQSQVNFDSFLDEMVLKTSKNNLAYVDNRRDAKEKYRFDFWTPVKKKSINIDKKMWYSKSEQFPDFIFKIAKEGSNLIRGSLLELKDSKGGSIASFNSTLPTKYKSLEEVDIINGIDLASRITSLVDGPLASEKNYRSFQRRTFYLVRTHKDDEDKVRISIIDGSFFETVPKEHLINQMFLNILRGHIEKKEISIAPEVLKKVEDSLKHITDQTIIAASQDIEKASVKPRLRIMAEVHPEGNPHSSYYPEIQPRSVNLILRISANKGAISQTIRKVLPEIKEFSIKHKRNGEHAVFQFRF